jgi:hypothetical protein
LFLENEDSEKCKRIYHKDFDPSNCHVDNLHWGTNELYYKIKKSNLEQPENPIEMKASKAKKRSDTQDLEVVEENYRKYKENVDEEIWVDAFDYPDYQVSSFGRIKTPTGHIPKKTLLEGYATIYMHNKLLSTKGSMRCLHRVVALSFIPNYDNKPEII